MPTALDLLAQPLPYLTADLPGIGGTIKDRPEDFVVEEVPAYVPSGEGEFLYLWVEKRGLSAEQMTSHLARELKIAIQDIGVAGLKDRHAVTRQWISVPARCEARLSDQPHPQISVLQRDRHRNKLRPGHLRGNRFSILVRNLAPDGPSRATAIADILRTAGVPNYYGEQRFGRDAETLQLGLDLLQGTKKPGDIPRARRKFLLKLALSSVQAALFNQALAARMADRLLDRVLAGDVMQVAATGGPFVVEDPEREQPRLDAREIILTGPMFGPKMKAPGGEPAEREARLLAAAGLTLESFAEYANLTSGTRRPYVFWPEDLALRVEPEGLRVDVSLPAGAYATVLLRELQKTP
jgi:tRNA pseudouridine13 synthase